MKTRKPNPSISSSSEFVPPAAKVLHLEVSLEVRSFLLSPICDMRVLQEGSLKIIFNIFVGDLFNGLLPW